MKPLKDLLERSNSPNKKVEYEFQQLGLEMTEHFGKKYRSQIWAHFYKAEYPLSIIRETWFIYLKTGKNSFPYYLGILKRKIK
jgi:hypothetical protein